VVGGQIRGEPQRLFRIYSEGNFIEATPETPYFQIGESKYGKPVIDRVINRHTNLLDAAKCVLVSFDSTMRSNISVGLPIDMLVYHNNSLRPGIVRRIDESDAYFNMIHNQWGEGLKRVFAQIPNPQWDDAG
jgi:putative proteasome-type protease